MATTTLERVIKRGEGSIGGKAGNLDKVIGHINGLIVEDSLPRILLDMLTVPTTTVLATGFFDETVNSLPTNVQDEIRKAESGAEYDYSIIENGFLNVALSVQLERELSDLARSNSGPIAIRSSSLFEDGTNVLSASFTGKYHSRFTGNCDGKVDQAVRAARLVYASTYNKDVIDYRKRLGLLGDWQNEKMALMIQPVVGREYNGLFFPLLAGVMYTVNGYVWNIDLKREDPFLRVVFGHGTRSVNVSEARCMSVTNIRIRPEGNEPKHIRKYTQRKVDALNLETGEIEAVDVGSLIRTNETHYPGSGDLIRIFSGTQESGTFYQPCEEWRFSEDGVLYFDDFLESNRTSHNGSTMIEAFRSLAKIVRDALGEDGDTEWAYNGEDGKLNFLQARPISHRKGHSAGIIPEYVTADKSGHTIIEVAGDMPNREIDGIEYLVYVGREAYDGLRTHQKHSVAGIIRQLNNKLKDSRFIMIGHGRWGSEDESLGVHVAFRDISNAKALIEYSSFRDTGKHQISPSYGCHFARELIDADIPCIPVDHNASAIFRDDIFTDGDGIINETDVNVRAAIKVLDVRRQYRTTAVLALDSAKRSGHLYLNKTDGYRTLDNVM